MLQEVTEDSIIRLGKSHVIYSGYYTFELTKDGVTKAAKAKFSYLYVRKPNSPYLLITTHNSGITPQGVTVVKKAPINGAAAPPPVSVAEVTAARDAWIAAVQALDVEATTKLYDTDNVRLLGTVDTEDNKLRNNHGLIHEYFEHFLSNDRCPPPSSCRTCPICSLPLFPRLSPCSVPASAGRSVAGWCRVVIPLYMAEPLANPKDARDPHTLHPTPYTLQRRHTSPPLRAAAEDRI